MQDTDFERASRQQVKRRTRKAGTPTVILSTPIAPETKAALEREARRVNRGLGEIVDALVRSAEAIKNGSVVSK